MKAGRAWFERGWYAVSMRPGAAANLTLDALSLPRFKLKRGKNRAFALTKGSVALTGRGNQVAGMIVLAVFSPLILALVLMLAAVIVPVTLIGALFPAGRRKIRAQRHKWKNPLRVELDREFIAPGETVEATILIDKIGVLERIAVHLVCEERASYTRGTDRYTDKHRAYDQKLFAMELDHPEVRPLVNPEDPGDWGFRFTVPETAMHSFKAPNNEVVWMLEIRRRYAESSEVSEEFGIMVYPLGVCEEVLRGNIAGPKPEETDGTGGGR